MKYTIREVKTEVRQKPEQTLELYLDQQRDGSVDLMGKDARGNVWFIIKLRTDGTFYRVSSIRSTIGLQVNDEGRIIEHEDSRNK